MIPLIDIMLVLLVIFLVTAPLLTHAVRVDLPQASSNPIPPSTKPIQIAARADGSLFWNGETTTLEELPNRMSKVAQDAPELHIYADAQTPYEKVAKIMAMASRTGLGRIGFVSLPEQGAAK